MTGPDSPPGAGVWKRPGWLGYAETLRGLGGVVSPLLAGFALAAIATIVTADDAPPLADWSMAALATSVGLLLFAMQTASWSLTRNSTPGDVLMWRPEATVSEDELAQARLAQAADLAEMTRVGKLALHAYSAGLIAFLLGVVLLMVPDDWTVGWAIGFGVTCCALALEVWWVAANNRWLGLPHPVSRRVQSLHRTEWTGSPPPLDPVGVAAVIDADRRKAAGLPPLDES